MAPHLRRKRAADVAAKAAALRAKAKARTTSSGASVTQTVVKKASVRFQGMLSAFHCVRTLQVVVSRVFTVACAPSQTVKATPVAQTAAPAAEPFLPVRLSFTRRRVPLWTDRVAVACLAAPHSDGNQG